MERYSEVLGLPVLCMDHGKKIGTVENVVFCPKDREIKAFILERKGCQVRKKLVLLQDVLNVGRDAVVVRDCGCVRYFREVENTGGLRNKGDLLGLRIYSRAGMDLGVVKDVLFDCTTGIIEGVEVSDGLLQDVVQGRNLLPLFGKVEFSEENILVDKEAVEEMEHTGGGLKKLLDKP